MNPEMASAALVAPVFLLGVGSAQAGLIVPSDGTGTDATGIRILEHAAGEFWNVEFVFDTSRMELDSSGRPSERWAR